MRNTVFFILVTLFVSCQRPSNDDIRIVKEFPINGQLTATVIEIPPVLLSSNNLVITGDDRLISSEERRDTMFFAFKLPDCEYIGGSGFIGNGPNELLSIPDPRSFTATQNGFYFMDEVSRLIEVEWIGKNFQVKSNRKVGNKWEAINGLIKLNENTVCLYNEANKDMEYRLMNLDTGESKEVSPYPDLTDVNLEDPGKKWFTYIRNNVAKPDGSRFASFYCYFKFFRIYDVDGNILNNISVEIDPYKDTYKADFDESLLMYASYPKATDKYIYIFCRNKKSGVQDADKTELQVWDWDGKPIAKYELDKSLKVFAISEKYNKLYGVHPHTEDKIYVYDLGEH